VSDLGADRGIILCEMGFQSGAVEAANLSNVQVTSLAALFVSSKDAIFALRLRDLYDRTEACRTKYWDIPKDVRIEKGLRFGVGDASCLYSGARVIEVCSELLSRAFRGVYPINIDPFQRSFLTELPERLQNHEELVTLLEPHISHLEAKLAAV
jgi:restriction system protein